jgi:hypothetical protein
LNVPGRFLALGADEAGFALEPYDAAQPLLLTYSTYLGGSGQDAATSVAVDASGNAYVAGWTESTDLPEAAGTRLGSREEWTHM